MSPVSQPRPTQFRFVFSCSIKMNAACVMSHNFERLTIKFVQWDGLTFFHAENSLSVTETEENHIVFPQTQIHNSRSMIGIGRDVCRMRSGASLLL